MEMINLFDINDYKIDTSKLGNLLHGSIVHEFEGAFAEYVGAKYACSANSASSLLFLSLVNLNTTIRIPSIIPPVVPNVIVNSGNKIEFYYNIEWVGRSYVLHKSIIDSAHEVTRNQYKNYDDPLAQMIFSFYPTKPVGGCDGGMVVSDDKDTVDWYRMMTLNGMRFSENNWDRKHVAAGYKMHATSIQAYIANENLKKLDKKNERLDEISMVYNAAFRYNNTSRHLYRVRVNNNNQFIEEMKRLGVVCGIHYGHCHKKPFYGWKGDLPASEKESLETVSLPFHENLTDQDIREVIKHAKRLANI
jgi:dTDP-4-amino-4,6-dideoxygalactose transaminase